MQNTSKRLKYHRVEAEMRRLVLTLPLGARLPAERDLAVSYDCNFLTVRKALKRLVDDGTVVRRVGSGTFILKHPKDTHATVSGVNNWVGILVYQHSNAYAYRVLQSIAHASIEQNIDVRSIWVGGFGDDVLAKVSLLKKDHCVAVILPWFPHDQIDEVNRFVRACELPVSLPLLITGLEKNCFEDPKIFGGLSTTLTIEEMCRYYELLGHERIAFLGPDSPIDVILQKKISSYIHYTSRANVQSQCGLVRAGGPAMDQLAERWKQYRGDLAIISYDDEHALRFMTAMYKQGLHAPTDYCIIGYNDTEGSRYSDPPLTTVRQNFDYIGHWLLKSAYGLAQGQVCQSSNTPRLKMIVRESCGGRNKITDSLRGQCPGIDIAVDEAQGSETYVPVSK